MESKYPVIFSSFFFQFDDIAALAGVSHSLYIVRELPHRARNFKQKLLSKVRWEQQRS